MPISIISNVTLPLVTPFVNSSLIRASIMHSASLRITHLLCGVNTTLSHLHTIVVVFTLANASDVVKVCRCNASYLDRGVTTHASKSRTVSSNSVTGS